MIEVIQLSKYTNPEILETKYKDYVKYGKDNDYFKYLINRYLNSPTNNAIINGMSRLIYGKGLDATDSVLNIEDWEKTKKLIKKADLRKFIIDRKILGMACFQVSYSKGEVVKISHFPMETLRSEKADKDGNIKNYYYHHDWENIKANEKPEPIPAFGFGNKKNNEVYVLKPYATGSFYYSPVDYVGALPYAVLEEEIADYLINDTINGFSGSKVVNFNNGIPDEEKRIAIKNEIINKLTGARGEKIIVAFGQNKETETTVTNFPLDNAPEHYQYLSDECRNKLIIGHRVTSPILIGVRETGGGLGNNADEIKNANLLFDNTVINSYQEEIIDALKEILAINNIHLDLYFKTSEPLQFIDTTGMDANTKQKETGVKMSKTVAEILIEKGETISEDEWEFMGEEDVHYDEEDSLLSKVLKFVKTGTARPNAKSEQDEIIDGYRYITRYRYAGNSNPERDFCKKMMQADKVYRKEDIIAMGEVDVNAGFGEHGADTYSIWLYKGGPRCQHKWVRQNFKSKIKVDVHSPNAPTISTNKAEAEGHRLRNPKETPMIPNDLPHKGFSPNNPNIPLDAR